MLSCTHRLSILSDCKARAYTGDLSTQNVSEFLRCTWKHVSETTTLQDTCHLPVDQAVVFVMHICTLYICALNTPQIRRSASRSIINRLARFNVSWLIREYPDLMLWVSLSGGPFSEGLNSKRFVSILQASVDKLGIITFEEATLVCAKFIWTADHAASASIFWLSVFPDEWPSLNNASYDFKPSSNDDTTCVFCGRESCCSPLRSGPKAAYGYYIPIAAQGMLWGTSTTEVQMLCNGTWYELDEDVEWPGIL